jgi:gliding motility-associated-like protein
MPNFLRGLLVLILLVGSSQVNHLQAQCVGLPTVSTLGSNKFPVGFCSPVRSRITYNVSFLSNVPNGSIEIFIDWGDGTTQILPRTTGINSYSADVTHNFPADSDCEFLVTVSIRYNGVVCPTTRQIQKVASWRTEAFNGGNPQLISPVTGTNEHLVCAGQNISVIFNDATNFNCNSSYIHTPPQAIETANTENRWQQIIYNTLAAPNVIPNVLVNGVGVTNAAGDPIISNLQDPRGVLYMPAPVVINDPRRRNSLSITAPGGFGPAFPQVGDVFEIRIRYWNFCNPYDDPTIPGPPANLINGDNAPVERTARVRIVAAPPAPTAADQTVCNGTTPSPFQVFGVPGGNIVNFYRDNAGVPGAIIGTPSTSTTLAVTSHPSWAGSTTARIYRVWASYRQNVVGACESPKILITRTIREQPDVPNPTTAPPAELCNLNNSNLPNSFSIVMPGGSPATETVGGATGFTWNTSLPSGITLGTNNASSANYNVNVSFAPGELFVDKTLTINRFFTSSPSCSRTRNFTIRVFNTAVGGTPSAVPDVCETTPVGTITLSNHRGELVGWQVSKDGGAFVDYTGPFSGNSITPGLLTDGVYQFRAVVRSSATFATGPCGPVFSSVETVVVSDNPDPATVGPDQNFCGVLTSTPLGGSDPGAGTGEWTYISSVPASLPAPTFSTNANDRNTTITAGTPGAYFMRWTVRNGTCISTADITVDFGGDPTNPLAGNDKSVCGLTTNMEGNTPIIGFGKWTLVSAPGGGDLDIIDDTSPTSVINLKAPFVYGTYTLRWTITSGLCPSEQDEVDLTFFEVPVATATDVPLVCIGPAPTFAAIDLSGSVSGAVLDGTWANVSGNGTISATSLNAGNYEATYTPNEDDYNLGIPIRVKLIANPSAASPCTPDEQEILINIDRKPLANPGSDIPNICESEVQLNAENPPPFGATGIWTTADAITFDNNTLSNTIVRNLPVGPVTVTWTLTSASGLCVSDPASITLTKVNPPAPSPSTVLECEVIPAGAPITTSIVLTNYEDNFGAGVPVAANREITWYKNSPFPVGTPVASPSIAENNISNGQLYFARIKDLTTNCVADGQLTINVRPLPPAADAIVSVCETDPVNDPGNARNVNLATAQFINPVTGGATNVDITWYPSFVDAQNSTNEITTTIDVLTSTVVHARISYNDSPPSCPDFAEVEIQVNAIQSITQIDGDPTVCMGGSAVPLGALPITTYQVPSIVGAKYTWNIPQGAGEFALFGGGGENDFFVLLKFPFSAAPVNPLNISVTIDYNGCSTSLITLPITRTQIPGAPVINGPGDICENSEAVEYNVVTPNASDYIWEIRKQSDGQLGGAFIASGQTSDLIRVNFVDEDVNITVIEQNGDCVGPAGIIPVTVNLLPQMANALVPICSQSPSNILLSVIGGSVPAPSFIVKSRVEDAGITFTGLPTIPPDLPGDQNVISTDAFTNKTGGPLNVNYTVVPVSAANCVGVSKIITLQVNPEPQMEVNLGKDLCSEEMTGVVLRTATGKASADQFIIESIDNPGGLTGNGIPAAGSTVDLNGINTNNWINIGGTSSLIRYNIKPRNSTTTCIGASTPPIEFLIHPKPIFDNVVNPAEICSETNTNITLDIVNVGTANITWSLDFVGPNILGATAGFSATPPAQLNNVLTNSSNTAVDFVRYRIISENIVSPTKSCLSDPLLLQVNVNPLPDVNPPSNLTACSDTPNNGLISVIDLTTLNGGIVPPADATILWYLNDPTGGGGTLIPDPTAHSVQNGITFFAEATSTQPSGCKEIVPVVYTIHNAVSFGLTKTDVTCAGSNDGQINVNVATGESPFNFQLGVDPPVLSASPYSFKNLPPSPTAPVTPYTITVTDKNGCSATDASQIVTEPGTLSATEQHTNVSCFFDSNITTDRNGSIQISALGGPSAPDAATPGSYNFTLLPGNITNATGAFGNLKPGIYTVRVADASNTFCRTEVTSVTLTVPPPLEVLSVNSRDMSCFGSNDGEIEVTAQGGTGTFTFSLDPTGQSVSQPANTIALFTSLAPAVYKIAIEDGNGCKAPQTSAVISPVTDINPGVIGADDDICPTEAANPLTTIISPFGGSNSFVYQWQFSVSGTVSNPTDPFNDPQWSNILGATGADLDPNATLNPNRSNPNLYYRKLVRDVPVRTNPAASCLTFRKTTNTTILRNRPEPFVQAVAPSIVCEGVQAFIYLEMLPGNGTPPMTFDIFDGDLTSVGQTGAQKSALYEIKNPHLQPVLTATNIKDAFGCEADPISFPITFQAKPTFTIAQPAQCADQTFEFTHTPDPNLEYEWNFGDNSSNLTYLGNNPPPMPVQHIYPAGSTSINTQYTVKLTAFGACPNHFDSKQITIFPSLSRNILEPQSNICAGETITFVDNSQGVTAATWHFEYVDDNGQGVIGPNINTTGDDVSFTLRNPTTQNPLQYLIYYQAQNNQNCTTSEVLGPINVYQEATASFDHTPALPEMVGGVMNVTYNINNYNGLHFDYTWVDQGTEIVPGSDVRNLDIRNVQYSEEKNLDVTLIVTNNAFAECTASDAQIIPIKLNAPQAAFTATPLAGCFPITVTTDNLSVSYDQFEWTLTNQLGISEVSALREPEFRITTPGVYTLRMIARKSGTSLVDNTAPPRVITAFEVPVSDFLLRMPQVYIGQMVEPINRSLFAQSYLWEFGDGETSTEYQPQHLYTLEGKDSVMLVASHDHGMFDLDGDGVLDESIVCSDTTKQPIHIIAGGALKIPNAFTPNVGGPNSGHEDLNFTNDVFLPIMEGVEEFTMHIFDRWGTLVFESKDKTIGWNGYDRNGRLMPAGVYVYKLVMRLGDGQRTTQVGDVTLVR